MLRLLAWMSMWNFLLLRFSEKERVYSLSLIHTSSLYVIIVVHSTTIKKQEISSQIVPMSSMKV
jgi:hypothetical protein